MDKQQIRIKRKPHSAEHYEEDRIALINASKELTSNELALYSFLQQCQYLEYDVDTDEFIYTIYE